MTPRRLLSDLFRLEHAVLFGRARAGLVALLEEADMDGKPVLVPSNICPAVLAAIVAAGALCRPVPVSPRTGLADDARMAAALRADPSRRGAVMPAHLYGFRTDYGETAALARQRGWLLIENDCMASLGAPGGERARTFGDVLLVSFGAGKAVDAQGGGAILTNESALAAALESRARSWPLMAPADEKVERHLTEARRSLRALGHAAMAEALLPLDLAHMRHRFDERLAPALQGALAGSRESIERRGAKAQLWRGALARFGEEILIPDFDIMSHWRFVCRPRRDGLRDILADRLREAGFDVGINYPPLTDGFPDLLAGQSHADAEDWGRNVLNFWLSEVYDARRIGQAADLIGRVIEEIRP